MAITCKYAGCNNPATCVVITSDVQFSGDTATVTKTFISADSHKLPMPKVAFPASIEIKNYAHGENPPLYYIPLCDDHRKELCSIAMEQIRNAMNKDPFYARMSYAERQEMENLIWRELWTWDCKSFYYVPSDVRKKMEGQSTEQGSTQGDEQSLERALRKTLLKAIIGALQSMVEREAE